MANLVCVRHAECYGNVSVASWHDDTLNFLTINGYVEAIACAKKLQQMEKFTAVVCSAYTRAKQTTRIIMEILGLPETILTTTPLFNERLYKSVDVYAETEPQLIDRFLHGHAAFIEPVIQQNQSVLFVSHGLLMRSYLNYFAGAPKIGDNRIHIAHATPYIVPIEDGKLKAEYRIG